MSSAKVAPAEEELVEAFKGLTTSEPTLGFKKVFQKLREEHPSWEVDNPAKERMRKLFREDRAHKEVGAPSSGTTEENSEAATSPSLTAPSSAEVVPPHERYSSTTSTWSSTPPAVPRRGEASEPASDPDMIYYHSSADNVEDYVVDPGFLNDIMDLYIERAKRRPANGFPGNGFPNGPKLMSVDLLRTIMDPGTNDLTIPDREDLGNDKYDLPHKLFWAEWQCFIGPHPNEPLPPPVPFVPHEEHTRFSMLFPHGLGGWSGPTGHRVPITFERYAHHMLRLDDQRFRHNREWLEWVLTRTKDKGLAASINCVLILFFNSKARHLGKGRIERKRVEENFPLKRLRNDELI